MNEWVERLVIPHLFFAARLDGRPAGGSLGVGTAEVDAMPTSVASVVAMGGASPSRMVA